MCCDVLARELIEVRGPRKRWAPLRTRVTEQFPSPIRYDLVGEAAGLIRKARPGSRCGGGAVGGGLDRNGIERLPAGSATDAPVVS